MCGKPGKGRYGTTRHAKLIISNITSFLPVQADISVTKVGKDGQDDCNISPSLQMGVQQSLLHLWMAHSCQSNRKRKGVNEKNEVDRFKKTTLYMYKLSIQQISNTFKMIGLHVRHTRTIVVLRLFQTWFCIVLANRQQTKGKKMYLQLCT